MIAESVLAMLTSLAVYREDVAPELAEQKRAQLESIAVGVIEASRKAPRPAREWAALMLSVGFHESTFSLRIQDGRCNWDTRECDAATIDGERVFRARGPWQLHRNLHTAPVWDQLVGVENARVQAFAASAMLRRGYWTCARSGAHWFVATINGFAGRRCDSRWKGLDQRLATFSRLLAVRSQS